MKIYLAARYSRREELCGYRSELEQLGHTVTSRWFPFSHQISDAGLSAEAKAEERTRFAQEDWEDLLAADMTISFTEEPRATNSRGGRHVEFGAALAKGQRVVVVGYRENVFHCLPKVLFFEHWKQFYAELIFDKCPDCRQARIHAYSDATTPGFFRPYCTKHDPEVSK